MPPHDEQRGHHRGASSSSASAPSSSPTPSSAQSYPPQHTRDPPPPPSAGSHGYAPLPTSRSTPAPAPAPTPSSPAPLPARLAYLFTVHLVTPLLAAWLALVLILSLLIPSRSRSRIAPSHLPPGPTYPLVPAANSTVGPALPAFLQDDLTLSSSACQREFPLLYPQLSANAAAWRARGGLAPAHLAAAARSCEGGCAHILIENRQVFVRTLTHDWQSRVRAVISLVRAAYDAASAEDKDAIEGVQFVFSTADKDGSRGDMGATWVLDKRVTDQPGQYLIPDFSFAAWPEAGIASYGEFRRDAASVNAKTPWRSKEDKLFWRGDPNVGAEARVDLMRQVAREGAWEWADVKRTSFWETGPDISRIVSPSEHCSHKFLLHSEGNSYSGRSKFILGCTSAVIAHDLEWTQHFHPALISQWESADQNIIRVPTRPEEAPASEGQGASPAGTGSARDTPFGGLETLARKLLASEQAAAAAAAAAAPRLSLGEKVARNAHRTLTARYLSPAATACYLRAALISYNSILARPSGPSGPSASEGGGVGGGIGAWLGGLPSAWQGPTSPAHAGGGVLPGAGAGEWKGEAKLAQLGVHGDVEVGTWALLGMPGWPPKQGGVRRGERERAPRACNTGEGGASPA